MSRTDSLTGKPYPICGSVVVTHLRLESGGFLLCCSRCNRPVVLNEDMSYDYAVISSPQNAAAPEPHCNHDAPAVVNGICECGVKVGAR